MEDELMEKLKVANYRGKKPILNDIAKAIKILDKISIEINSGESRTELYKVRNKLFSIISNEGYEFSKTERLIKKK